MEKLSQISNTVRQPGQINIPAYFRDHYVEGRVVLPAVEAMCVLAQAVRQQQPDTDLKRMNSIRFGKFLYLLNGFN